MTPVTPSRRRKPILTDATIAAVTTPSVIRDTVVRGLQLRVRNADQKSWSMVYRIRGQQKRITFGPYPEIKLADARKRAREARDDVRNGIDPQAAKRVRREADTFGDLARTYVEQHASKKRSGKEDDRMLRADVLPAWKDRLVQDITRRDARELVNEIAERAPVYANRVVSLLSKIFTFAIDNDIVQSSPMVRFKKPTKEQSRDRVLTYDELRTFWSATEAMDAPMQAFYRLRLVTGQRGIEVSTMKWADVDLETGWWTVPASVAKNKLSHRVPLSQMALDVLNTLPNDTTFVVEGARGKRQQAEAAEKIEIDDFRGHDLRRTAATYMTSAGVSRFIVGTILNHVEPGVTKVYDRAAYDKEKREALDLWARELTAILKNKPAEVLPFAPKCDTIRPDADPLNADWPKRTNDIDVDGSVITPKVAQS